jgi:hypothetical protein
VLDQRLQEVQRADDVDTVDGARVGMSREGDRGQVNDAPGARPRNGVAHLGEVRELGVDLVGRLGRMLRELDDLVALRAQERAKVATGEAVRAGDEDPRS